MNLDCTILAYPEVPTGVVYIISQPVVVLMPAPREWDPDWAAKVAAMEGRAVKIKNLMCGDEPIPSPE